MFYKFIIVGFTTELCANDFKNIFFAGTKYATTNNFKFRLVYALKIPDA